MDQFFSGISIPQNSAAGQVGKQLPDRRQMLLDRRLGRSATQLLDIGGHRKRVDIMQFKPPVHQPRNCFTARACAARVLRLAMTGALTPQPALVLAGLETLPSIISNRGERANCRFIEFFTASSAGSAA
jgi:hypothetical protein